MTPTEWPPKPVFQDAIKDARALLEQQKAPRQEKKRIRNFYKDEQRAMRREDDDVAMRRAELALRRRKQAERDRRGAMRWQGAKTAFQRHAKAMVQNGLQARLNDFAAKVIKRHIRGSVPVK